MGLLDKILRAGEGKAVKQLAKIALEVKRFENQTQQIKGICTSKKHGTIPKC